MFFVTLFTKVGTVYFVGKLGVISQLIFRIIENSHFS